MATNNFEIPPSRTTEAVRARNRRRVRDKTIRGHFEFTAPSERERWELQENFNRIRSLLGFSVEAGPFQGYVRKFCNVYSNEVTQE